jgi:hypothetical protein
LYTDTVQHLAPGVSCNQAHFAVAQRAGRVELIQVLAEWVEQCHLLILTPYDVRFRRQVAPTACYAASPVEAGEQSVFRKERVF